MTLELFLDKSRRISLFEQLRDQLIVDLHMGKVKPGDRLPSVRRLARKYRINTKTVSKLYQRLEAEGYLTAKPGSGVYIAPLEKSDLSQLYYLRTLRLIRKHLMEARQLQIDPEPYAELMKSYLQKSKLQGVKLLIVECNEEQINLFAKEIRQALKAATIPMLLETLQKGDKRTAARLKDVACFITTAFHFAEVEALAKQHGKLAFEVTMNPRYYEALLKAATNGRLGMIASNTSFFPAFTKRLAQLGIAKKVIDRIVAIDDGNLEEIKNLMARVDSVYISPLCDREIKKMVPRGIHLISIDNHLSSETIEALEAMLLFQVSPANKALL